MAIAFKTRHHRQRGLTLIEILVAVLLSSLLLAGVAQIFQGNRQTQRFQTALTRIQENGRFALEELNYNLRQAAFRGCGGSNKNVNNMLTGPGADQFDLDTSDELRGHRFKNGNWVPQDPGIAAVDDQATVRKNDVLTFTTLDPGLNSQVATPHKTNNANIDFTPNANIEQCEVIIISNCTDMFVFVNTNNSVANGTVTHSNGNNCLGSGVDVQNSTNKINTDMGGASLLSFKSYTYYIDQPDDAAVPSLFREDEAGNSVELVPGVQAMSLDYGEDTTGDGQVDSYTEDPATVGNWVDVVGVRIEFLLVSATDNITDEPQTYTFNGNQSTATDNRLRQVFTTTATLRNRAE